MESKIPYSRYINSQNPIKDSIIWNKSFPDIKEFSQKYKKEDIIPEKINIKKILYEYFEQLKTIESKAHEILISLEEPKKNLSKKFLHYKKNKKIFKEINKSLKIIMDDNFSNLKKNVRLHINIFCYLFTIIEKEFVYKHFVDYDINIIFWAILFHDIGKYICMHPILEKDYDFNGGDKMHPYKSALIFIDTLLNKKLINLDEKNMDIFQNKYLEFKKLIFNSYIAKDDYYCFDMKYFDDIIKYINFLKSLGENNNWFCEVFILIIFHQNLPNNENHMNKRLLSKEQIKEAFDLRLIEMMRIIMVLDSLSHQIFDPSDWVSQINKQLDKVRTYFNTENKIP